MKRNSSIETLRILSIIAILALHYALQSGSESFGYVNLSLNSVFIQSISMFGRLSCTIFALITGYYMIESDTNYTKIISKDFELLFKLVIYSYFLIIINTIFHFASLSGGELVKAGVPFVFENWYIKYYLLFSLLVPYLNIWLKKLNELQYRKLVFIVLLLWSVIPTLTINTISSGELDFFIAVYIIGGYIRLHVNLDSINNAKAKGFMLISIVALIGSVLFFDYLGIILKSDTLIAKATWFKNYNSILAVCCAISVFVYFLKKNFYVGAINTISKTALGVYILSDSIVVRNYIWNVVSPNENYVENPYLHAPIKIFVVFVLCMLIDLVYDVTLGKIVQRISESLTNRIMRFVRTRLMMNRSEVDN